MSFLGHVVGHERVKAASEKVETIREWPVPCYVAKVRSLLGMCSYYRRFVKDFVQIAAPLHHLTRGGGRFLWSKKCQEAFNKMKGVLMTAPVLPNSDPTKLYLLDCDAIAEGVGAGFSQVVDGQM